MCLKCIARIILSSYMYIASLYTAYFRAGSRRFDWPSDSRSTARSWRQDFCTSVIYAASRTWSGLIETNGIVTRLISEYRPNYSRASIFVHAERHKYDINLPVRFVIACFEQTFIRLQFVVWQSHFSSVDNHISCCTPRMFASSYDSTIYLYFISRYSNLGCEPNCVPFVVHKIIGRERRSCESETQSRRGDRSWPRDPRDLRSPVVVGDSAMLRAYVKRHASRASRDFSGTSPHLPRVVFPSRVISGSVKCRSVISACARSVINHVPASVVPNATRESERRGRPRRHQATAGQPCGK